jgi:hypothetical protein
MTGNFKNRIGDRIFVFWSRQNSKFQAFYEKIPTFNPSKLYCLIIEFLFIVLKLYLSFLVSITLGFNMDLS